MIGAKVYPGNLVSGVELSPDGDYMEIDIPFKKNYATTYNHQRQSDTRDTKKKGAAYGKLRNPYEP